MTSSITSNQSELVFKLNRIIPNCYFTGSFALSVLNMISRPINGIDICVPLEHKKRTLYILNTLKIQYKEVKENCFMVLNTIRANMMFTTGTTSADHIVGYNQYYYTCNINRSKVNIFFTEEENTYPIKYKGVNIKISNPKHTIDADHNYCYNRYVHHNKVSVFESDIESCHENRKKWQRIVKINQIYL